MLDLSRDGTVGMTGSYADKGLGFRVKGLVCINHYSFPLRSKVGHLSSILFGDTMVPNRE